MRLIRGALKGAVAAKAIQIVRREAAKPENQRRAKELLEKVRTRGSSAGRAGR
ncbi:hypothetical protein [Georgenia sp. SUBG003]|uniref:hypothetical protein n=1 Tax=Georgenia sp. SUBG003 TaxID=1497974 RepID=UPI000B013F7B